MLLEIWLPTRLLQIRSHGLIFKKPTSSTSIHCLRRCNASFNMSQTDFGFILSIHKACGDNLERHCSLVEFSVSGQFLVFVCMHNSLHAKKHFLLVCICVPRVQPSCSFSNKIRTSGRTFTCSGRIIVRVRYYQLID